MAVKRYIIFIIVLLIVHFGYINNKKAEEIAPSMEEPQIVFKTDKWVHSWVSMWNSYDLSMVDKLFLTDSRVTYFSSEKEGLIKGIDAVRNHHKEFGFVEGGKVQENKLWVENLNTTIFNKTAIVTGIWYFRRGPEGSVEIQRGPVTFVYVLQGKNYRLAHLHFANY